MKPGAGKRNPAAAASSSAGVPRKSSSSSRGKACSWQFEASCAGPKSSLTAFGSSAELKRSMRLVAKNDTS